MCRYSMGLKRIRATCQWWVFSRFSETGNRFSKLIEFGDEILACKTYLQSRKLGITEACPISTMIDCVEEVEWVDKIKWLHLVS